MHASLGFELTGTYGVVNLILNYDLLLVYLCIVYEELAWAQRRGKST
jgi:hypothetical protein